jgi:hypothetical protein
MGVKRLLKLPPVSVIGANITGTIDIPVGPRYHAIWLSGTNKAATTLAGGTAIGDIRLKVNGKVQRVHSAIELNALNTFEGQLSIYGMTDTSGGQFNLPIFFAEPWRKSYAATDSMAWGTGDISSFQLEIDFLANNPTAIYAVAEVDNSIVTVNGKTAQAPLGLISKVYRNILPYTGSSALYTNFPKRDFYQSISFFDSTITKVTVTVDSYRIRELLKVDNDPILTSRGMVPVSTRFDVVFDYDDVPTSALPMVNANGDRVQDFQIQIDSSSGTTRNINALYTLFGPAD